jgi:Protein of unknown function (DUF732)
MKVAVVPAVVAAGITCTCAPVAQADTDSYMQYLTSHGVPNTGPGTETSSLVQTGNNECAAIGEGKSDLFLMDQLINAYGMDIAQAQHIVYAAHHYLCPGA